MKRLNQSGSHVLAVLVVVAALAVVGLVGYRVQQSNKQNDVTASTTSKVPTAISTKADLSTTSKALDQSSAQLDSGLNDTSLDADLNSML